MSSHDEGTSHIFVRYDSLNNYFFLMKIFYIYRCSMGYVMLNIRRTSTGISLNRTCGFNTWLDKNMLIIIKLYIGKLRT